MKRRKTGTSWDDYFYAQMRIEQQKILDHARDEGCPVCKSHDLSWIKFAHPDDWSPLEYIGCLNCIRIRNEFTTA